MSMLLVLRLQFWKDLYYPHFRFDTISDIFLKYFIAWISPARKVTVTAYFTFYQLQFAPDSIPLKHCKMARWLPIESNPEVSGQSDSWSCPAESIQMNVLQTQPVEIPKFGNVGVFVQLIYRPMQAKNHVFKNPNIA